MKVKIYNIYSEKTETFQGDPDQIRSQLNAHYGFLGRYNHNSLQEDLRKLSETQAFFVNVEG